MAGQLPHMELAKPAVGLVYGAGAAFIASLALLLVRSFPAAVAGYVLAPLVVALLVSLYRAQDGRASQSPTYANLVRERKLATWILVASFVVGLIHAWTVATYLAKMWSA